MKTLVLYYSHPACDIFYNIELKSVETHWKGIFVYGQEFRKIIDKIAELVKEQELHSIIADATNMKMITAEDQKWIINDWYYRALEAGLTKEAIIVTQDTFNEITLRKVVSQYDDEKIETKYFNNYDDAVSWISSNVIIEKQ